METQPQATALKDALYKSEVYDRVDMAANVTCLVPSNDAFAKTGKKPPRDWNDTAIEQLVLYVLALVDLRLPR